MSDTSAIRTQLTDNMLKENKDILTKIINACDTCLTKSVSWSQACKDQKLDHLAARHIMLSLSKCTDTSVPLSKMDKTVDLYDNYEKFYQTVFGDRTLTTASLPFDYKESVLYVLDNMLTSRESVIIMRRFGIGDYDIPETLKEIGDSFHVLQERIRQIELKAIRKCRTAPNAQILKQGIEEYEITCAQANENNQIRLNQIKEEHAALVSEIHEANIKQIKSIVAENYENVLSDTALDHLIESFKNTSINILELSTRSHNALARAGYNTIFDLIKICDMNKLIKIYSMGKKSIEEIIYRLNKYVKYNYGVSVELLREIYPELKSDI